MIYIVCCFVWAFTHLKPRNHCASDRQNPNGPVEGDGPRPLKVYVRKSNRVDLFVFERQ